MRKTKTLGEKPGDFENSPPTNIFPVIRSATLPHCAANQFLILLHVI